MYISKEYKFVFIHVYKTGGTSIRKAIEPYVDVNLRPDGHATARDARMFMKEYGMNPNEFTFFCVVRNPFEWHKSLYNYIRVSAWHPDHELFNTMTFKEYVLWLKDKGSTRPKFYTEDRDDSIAYHTFQDFIRDDNGNVIVDYVLKNENLNWEIKELCPKLGIDEIELGELNKGPSKDELTYDEEMIEVISEIHKEDLKMFGYEL